MNIIKQFGIILFLWLCGELISKSLGVPIPGSVIGMVLLFICLCSGVV
ncbi:MAG: LrgA family, partial [Firmicutes bacterium]|nr:LrgA family [Bacillota bacterium]